MLKAEQVLIWVDTREQAPFCLSPLRQGPATLTSGDYTLAAAPSVAIVERKSGGDLLNCIGNDRQRFTRELERLKAFPARVVLVETDLEGLCSDPRTQLSRESIVGTLAAWTARYCPVMLCGSREAAQDFCWRFLLCEARRIWVEAESFRRELERDRATCEPPHP